MFQYSIPFEFVIDVSGTPKGSTYFGMASFHPGYKARVLGGLYAHCRECNYQKGRQISRDGLIEILSYLSEHRVKMALLHFSSIAWKENYDKYKRHHDFLEKMYASNYMKLLSLFMWKNNAYTLTSCVESQAGKIDRIFHNCNRLASKLEVDLDFNYGHDKTNRGIRVADIIANAGRKIKREDLENIENLIIVKDAQLKHWTKWTTRYLFEIRKKSKWSHHSAKGVPFTSEQDIPSVLRADPVRSVRR